MLIYIAIALLFIILYSSRTPGLVVTMMLILILLSIFRSESVGTDYSNYINTFKDAKYELENYNFSEIFNYIGFIENEEIGKKQLEPFWLLINFFILEIGGNYYIVNFIVTILILSLYFVSFKLTLKSLEFPFILFFILFYFFISFNTARQSIAISFVLLSFVFLNRKEWVLFALAIFISYLFHYSSIFALLVLPFYWLRSKIRFHYTLLFVSLLFGNLLSEYIIDFLTINSVYWGYSTLKWSNSNILISTINYALQILLFVFVTKSNKKLLFSDLFTSIWFFGLISQNLFLNYVFFHRIADYFLVAQLVAIPRFFGGNYRLSAKMPTLQILFYLAISALFIFNLYFNKHGVIPYIIQF